jgi:hypothetical protein
MPGEFQAIFILEEQHLIKVTAEEKEKLLKQLKQWILK